MSQTAAYHRADVQAGAQRVDGIAALSPMAASPAGAVRWFCVLPVSLFLCVVMTVLTVLAANLRGGPILASTLIPVAAFALLALLVLAVNPICALLLGKARLFTRAELVCIFAAMVVTAGIPGYGLAHQLVPLITSPYNPAWATPQRDWDQSLHPHLFSRLYLHDPDAIHAYFEGVYHDGDGNVISRPMDGARVGEHITYGWQVARAISWRLWLGPLAGWLAFVTLAYAMFYCLSYFLLPAWANREKLVFPLAQLPEALLPDDQHPRVPAIFRDVRFWLGFSVSFLVLCYNGAASGNLIPLTRIHLGMAQWTVAGIIRDSAFAGMQGGGQTPGLQFLIIFTAIGIAFLLPKETSFSIWFYYLAGAFFVLVLVWRGHGQSLRDFPSDWLWQNNPLTAIGGGALLAFAAVMLYRAAVYQLARRDARAPKCTLGLGVSGAGLVLSLVGLTGWFLWNGLSVGATLLFLAVLLLILTALLRIVAESGVFWTQLHVSFFHLYKALGLARLINPGVLGILLPTYWILFLDVKTFAGSAMINSFRMQSDVEQRVAKGNDERRRGRRVFHINLITCIAVTMVASVAFLIIVAHVRGGQQMRAWFFLNGPLSLFEQTQRAITQPSEFMGGTVLWFAVGVVYLALSLRISRSLFWWPHPIGLLMLCNPLISYMWFSFFIGWVCKALAVRYGGKQTYDVLRRVFIGLILGELLAIFLWTIIGLVGGYSAGLTLNRYGA